MHRESLSLYVYSELLSFLLESEAVLFFLSFWPATSKQSLLTGQWISACVVNLWPAPHSQSCELHHPRTALHCTPVHSTYC
uniref:Uncharacterized protein n=1 Tax=Anguilla anguilla TaxID=7936 RepID=A0A0E9PS09_ANGAN